MLHAHTHNFWLERTQVAVYLCHPSTMKPLPLVPHVPVAARTGRIVSSKSNISKQLMTPSHVTIRQPKRISSYFLTLTWHAGVNLNFSKRWGLTLQRETMNNCCSALIICAQSGYTGM